MGLVCVTYVESLVELKVIHWDFLNAARNA